MKLKQDLSDLVQRSVDANVKIAVTGLSRAGKTAFITSLVNQLLHTSTHKNLPLFSAQIENRLVGAKRVEQQDLLVPAFQYESAIHSLEATPPKWPSPTRDVSEIRVALKYRSNKRMKNMFSKTHTVYIDIVDYPGEWLLDLPMLSQTYEAWSEQQFSVLRGQRQELATEWLRELDKHDFSQPIADQTLENISTLFTDYLHVCKEKGLHWVQPGRFILPGELAGAPVLHFFPVPSDSAGENLEKTSAYQVLKRRYSEYQNKVIKQFYQRHFSTFDRQIVLVDCLTPLNHSEESFNDMKQAIEQLLASFKYGRTGIIGRLFSPKIDKVLFAATKADHITPDQHNNLVSLLNQLVHPAWQHVAYQDIDMSCTSLASVRTTKAGLVEQDGQSFHAIKGATEEGEALTIYPGEVPSNIPNSQFWQQNQFQFKTFRPMNYQQGEPLPHIRIDRVLEYLIGDKLQ
jgi:predicted YcjX-like family ATPase